MEKTVDELAALIGGRVVGDGTRVITGVAAVTDATEHEAAFLLDEYMSALGRVQAGVVLVEHEPEDAEGKTLIVTPHPKGAFASLVRVFVPAGEVSAGVHPTAVVDATATVDATASVGPYVIIGPRSTVGAHVVLQAHTVLGAEVAVGADTTVYAGAVLHDRTVVGERVVIRSNAVIGGEGFGFATMNGKHERIPQIGRVVIGDDVEVGAGTTIDNGTFGETSIGRGTKIDNLVHLGHNVRIGEDCFIIAQVGVAGSTTIGNHVVLAGQTGVSGHITIADHVTCGGKTGVIGSIKESGTYVGFPARPHRQWGRIEGVLNHLPDLLKRVRRLEKALSKED